jgi:hypothetical protein
VAAARVALLLPRLKLKDPVADRPPRTCED